MAAPPQPAAGQLRERREAVVREHMESENRHDFDTTIGTFSHPRYEIVATGDVFDGEAEARGYFAETRAAFPDQRNEVIALHHADDGVIAEFHLLGNSLGGAAAIALAQQHADRVSRLVLMAPGGGWLPCWSSQSLAYLANT